MPLSKIQDIGNQVVPNLNPNRNLLINGAMNVAQRATTATGIGANADTNKYPTMDRWNTFHGGSTAGRLTISQDGSAPAGFGKSMKFDCTTADTSIAAGEEFLLSQKLEGQNLQTISKGTSDAKQMVFSWYAKGTPKTYGIEIYDNDNTRHFSNTWTVTSSWQRFTQVIPADTTGTFDDDNNLSLYVNFWLHAGTTYSSGSSASSWAAISNANRAAGVGSIFSSTDNELFLTGTQLEVGSVSTEFEHEPFERTFLKCSRYFQKYYAGNEYTIFLNGGIDDASGDAFLRGHYRVQLRATPSYYATNSYLYSRPGGTISYSGTPTNRSSPDIATIGYNVGAGSQGHAIRFESSGTSGTVEYDAEL